MWEGKVGNTRGFGEIRLGLHGFLAMRGGLMDSVLDSGSSGPGSGPGLGHCVVSLGKTLYCNGASLHPGV